VNNFKDLQIVEVKGMRTLTSKQLAECYGTTTNVIKKNFSRNREKYVEGKHYICFSGDELKRFKDEVTKSHLVNNQVENFDLVANRTSHLYLWTEKGALLHAKSLNTDKAWEVYDYLVDFYFRVKEKPTPEKTAIVPVADTAEPSKAHPQTALPKSGFDIAPAFRELISLLPTDALDEMEKCFRNEKSMAIKLAATSILAEKMKRQLA
jgi:hypothetical protein